MKNLRQLRRAALLLTGASAALWAAACGGDLEESCDPEYDPGCIDGSTPANNNPANNNPANNNPANNNPVNNNPNNNPFIPEPEVRFNFRRPQSSALYVFVANPDLDSVAKINGQTLEITSIEVGDRPTLVRTSAVNNTAVVLNEGSDEVSVIHAAADRDDVVHLPIRAGFNNLAVAPGGDWALAWLDADAAESSAALGSFQDVSLIRLEQGAEAAYNVAVGFRVLEVSFDDEGERAFVVTEDGVSILALNSIQADTSAPPRLVSEDPLEDAEAVDREVEITDAGDLALVRSSVLQGLNLVALQGQASIRFLALPGIPTDVDLYPDSTTALAVIRGTRQIAVIALDRAMADDPEAVRLYDIPDGPVGQAVLDTDANRALLYSVSDGDTRVVRVDLDSGRQQVWDLRKAVTGLQLSPRGRRAIAFHNNASAAELPEDLADRIVALQRGYTILDLRSGFAKLQTTAAPAGEFAFSPDGQWVYMLIDDLTGTVRQVERANLETFRIDRYTLASSPRHIGPLPGEDSRYDFYVSQDHPSGRMTFFAITGEVSKTVTGFELNAQIE